MSKTAVTQDFSAAGRAAAGRVVADFYNGQRTSERLPAEHLAIALKINENTPGIGEVRAFLKTADKLPGSIFSSESVPRAIQALQKLSGSKLTLG